MFNKKIAEKMICLASAIFFIGVFTIFKKDLSHSDIFLVAFIFILLLSRHSNKKNIKKLSTKYENSKHLLSEVFKHFPDAIFLKDLDSKYVSCNDIFFKTINLKPEELIGKNDSVFLNDENTKRAHNFDKSIIQNKETINYDLNYTTDNGEHVIYNVIKAPMLDGKGKVIGILGIAREATIHRNLQAALEEKQLQLSAILENMPFGALMKDLSGKIICTNKKNADLFGLKPEDMPGLLPGDLFPEEITEKMLVDDNNVIEKKITTQTEANIETPLGPKWIEVIKSPILDDEGNVQGIVVIMKDIELQKEIEAQKETFVATLTHDLKVPTVAQIRAIELLLKGSMGEIPKEQIEVLGQILNSCRYMFNMISTLLSTYRYEEGIKRINCEEFNFIDLVSECCNEISCLAKEKEQILAIKNNLPEHIICADKLEIKRVITNLLSNAIFYSHKNSEIEISMEDYDDQVALLVTSHSQVIPRNQLEKLFDKYVSNAHQLKQSGIGLGLYLTKQIIMAHNGEVIAESDEINGNTFGFKIPKKCLAEIIKEETSNTSNFQN